MMLEPFRAEVGAVNAGLIDSEFSSLDAWEVWRLKFRAWYDKYSIPDTVGLVDESDLAPWRAELNTWESMAASEGISIPPYVNPEPQEPEPSEPDSPEEPNDPPPVPTNLDGGDTEDNEGEESPNYLMWAGIVAAALLAGYLAWDSDSE